MTLEEKVGMIHANSAFTSGGVARLNIPELVMSDGPHGVRHEHTRYYDQADVAHDANTYLPVGTALAATWNRELGYQFGAVLGREAAWRGKDVILGPGINIIRDPLNGRNFEYLTEDPYLNGRMAVNYIRGVQDQGVAVSVKHYIANSLEYERRFADVRMDERTFREIYLPGFKASVQEGGALTVMAAYNKFRGEWSGECAFLLDEVLRDNLGFEGIVISDWNAIHRTLPAAGVGLDIEMGTDLSQEWQKPDYDAFYLADPLIELVKTGQFDEAKIDRKVSNILRVMDKIHMFSGNRQVGAYNTAEHQGVARRVADESIVLLKNEGVLPFDRSRVKTLAVIGANANRKHAGGGGSSQVKALFEVTALEGLQNLLSDNIEIKFAPGYRIARDARADATLVSRAVQLASEADAVIYVGGLIHGYTDEWDDNAYDAEFLDKPDMHLPFEQDELLQAVLAVNPNAVVVLQSGGPVDMRRWQSDANAIVQAWYGGMHGGDALAAMLFGDVNPSGKLPVSFPKMLSDSPAHALARYPDEKLIIDHTEGLYVGYRYFDSFEVEPAFAFGHGLSYTEFEYSDIDVDCSDERAHVRVRVRNSGQTGGSEVAQVYVHDVAASLPRPYKELKDFQKIQLDAGASQVLKFELPKEAFSYYDSTSSSWVLEPGVFSIQIGSSSSDIRVTENCEF